MKIKYGSLFTGIGGFEIAINKVFKDNQCRYYSEFDTYADQTYLKHYPDHLGLNVGDVERAIFDEAKGKILLYNEYRVKKLFPKVDLLVGGPPCTDLSIAKGKRLGLAGPKSRLFYAFLSVKLITKPKYFLMENVASMNKKSRDQISELLKVEPVEICVDRFTPQKRRRLYWFNWDFDESKLPKKGYRLPELIAWSSSNDYKKDGSHKKRRQREIRDGRANTLTTGNGCGSFSSKNYVDMGGVFEKRILTSNECEQLQGFPENYTAGVPNSKRFRQIGNSVNPQSVEAILKQCPLNK